MKEKKLYGTALGCVQLIRRKSLKKVDREILCLGGVLISGALLAAFAAVKAKEIKS